MKTNTITRAGIAFVTTLAIGMTAGGCDDDDDVIVPATGSLVQRWTIEGSSDPNQCSRFGAEQMRFVVIDAFGTIEATQFTPCSLFQLALNLPVDDYTANATFVDAAGVPVSTTLFIPRFIVVAGQTTLQTIDFNAASMTAPP